MPPKILIVDDEPDILELVQTRLQMAGYETLEAESGEDALKMFFTARPDLLVKLTMLVSKVVEIRDLFQHIFDEKGVISVGVDTHEMCELTLNLKGLAL